MCSALAYFALIVSADTIINLQGPAGLRNDIHYGTRMEDSQGMLRVQPKAKKSARPTSAPTTSTPTLKPTTAVPTSAPTTSPTTSPSPGPTSSPTSMPTPGGYDPRCSAATTNVTHGYHDGKYIKAYKAPDVPNWKLCARKCADYKPYEMTPGLFYHCEFWTMRLEGDHACLLLRQKGKFRHAKEMVVEGDTNPYCASPTKAPTSFPTGTKAERIARLRAKISYLLNSTNSSAFNYSRFKEHHKPKTKNPTPAPVPTAPPTPGLVWSCPPYKPCHLISRRQALFVKQEKFLSHRPKHQGEMR
jgi:hypothetical protein